MKSSEGSRLERTHTQTRPKATHETQRPPPPQLPAHGFSWHQHKRGDPTTSAYSPNHSDKVRKTQSANTSSRKSRSHSNHRSILRWVQSLGALGCFDGFVLFCFFLLFAFFFLNEQEYFPLTFCGWEKRKKDALLSHRLRVSVLIARSTVEQLCSDAFCSFKFTQETKESQRWASTQQHWWGWILVAFKGFHITGRRSVLH